MCCFSGRCECTIIGRFNVAYGAPAPREGVRRREGGTVGAGGYTRVLPLRGYRPNPNPLTLTLTLTLTIQILTIHAVPATASEG